MGIISNSLGRAQRFWALSEVVLMLYGAALLNARAEDLLGRNRRWRRLAQALFRASEALGRGAHSVFEVQTRRRGRG